MPTPVNWSTDGTLLWDPDPLSLSVLPSPSSWDWLPSTSPFFITNVALPPGTNFWNTSLKFFDTWKRNNHFYKLKPTHQPTHFYRVKSNAEKCFAWTQKASALKKRFMFLSRSEKCMLYKAWLKTSQNNCFCSMRIFKIFFNKMVQLKHRPVAKIRFS